MKKSVKPMKFFPHESAKAKMLMTRNTHFERSLMNTIPNSAKKITTTPK